MAATGHLRYNGAIKRKGTKRNDNIFFRPDGFKHCGGGAGVILVSTGWTALVILLMLVSGAVGIYLLILLIRVLRKYLRSGEVRQKNRAAVESLAKALKGHRERCRMTQEFVAESIGVSRQAVSKWETGAADPSTANLLALAKLYGVSPEELLHNAQNGNT